MKLVALRTGSPGNDHSLFLLIPIYQVPEGLCHIAGRQVNTAGGSKALNIHLYRPAAVIKIFEPTVKETVPE